MLDLRVIVTVAVLGAAALILIVIGIGLAVHSFIKWKAQKDDNDELQEVVVHKTANKSDRKFKGKEYREATETYVPASIFRRYPVILTQTQRYMLEGEEWLDGITIDQAQEILQKQFEADGLQSCEAAQLAYKPVFGPSVQIHHDEDRLHWFTSCFRNGRILIADSSYKTLSRAGMRQLIELYSRVAHDPLDIVTFVDVDQQPNGYDCGLYAIANAYEFLVGNESFNHVYNNSVMRAHLAMCLERGFFTQFPRMVSMY
ncbi:uncharacterized protein [Engystomops pustulosus]|uniref:uncharacterized protein n=1 Tax=Engystomops pustulosus TaxID=76066 RepID=UPI003AFB4009